VICLQGIGDLLLLTPALSLLRKGYPKAEISILISNKAKDVVLGNPNIDELIVFKHENKNIFRIFKLLRYLSRKHYDLSICSYPTGLRSALAGYISGAKIRIGQDVWPLRKFPFLFTNKIKVSEVKHAVEMNLDLLKPLKLNPDISNRKLFFPLEGKHKEFVKELRKINHIADRDFTVCIHPTACAESRRWPIDRFIELANNLVEMFNATIILLVAANEKNIANEIEKGVKKPLLAMVGAPLKTVAAMIESASLFIGNNSGLMHIATSVETPTIGLFGDTDPRIHSPYGRKYIIVRSNLDCSPCYYPHLHGTLECAKLGRGVVRRKFKCMRNNYECMKLISVGDVLKAVEYLISGENEELKNE
jgi:ADP-heptose:LPS heptosyltransferase